MVCRLFGTKPLSEPLVTCSQCSSPGTHFSEIWMIYNTFQVNEFDDGACKMTTIFFQRLYVKTLLIMATFYSTRSFKSSSWWTSMGHDICVVICILTFSKSQLILTQRWLWMIPGSVKIIMSRRFCSQVYVHMRKNIDLAKANLIISDNFYSLSCFIMVSPTECNLLYQFNGCGIPLTNTPLPIRYYSPFSRTNGSQPVFEAC